jgi:hypothetical protein
LFGLQWGVDDEIDGIIAGMSGERAATAAAVAARLGTAFNSALFIAQMSMQMLPGADAVRMMTLIAQGRGGELEWMDVLGAALDLGGPFAKVTSRFAGMLMKYASKGSALKLSKYGDDLAGSIGKACNCFVAGTQVKTPEGTRY